MTQKFKPGDRIGPFVLVDAETAFGKPAYIIHTLDVGWARKNESHIRPWDWSAGMDKAEIVREYKDYVFAMRTEDAATQAHYTVDGIPGEQEAAHYRVEGVPEAWEVIEALQSSWPEDVRYHVGNVLKYVFRLGRKQGASVESDLEKIRNYADRAIKVLGKAGGK